MTGSSGDHVDSPIEVYLDELTRSLGTDQPRRARHLIAESETHLRDAAEAAMSHGLDAHAVELEAVARFGTAPELAAAERQTWSLPMRAVLGQFLRSALALGGLGAVAVGLSGLLAWFVGGVWGQRVLVQNPSAADLTTTNCARWIGLHPHAADCSVAAMNDWYGEVIFYRIAVGVLGVAALSAYAVLRRRVGSAHRPLLPRSVLDTIGAGAFFVAAAATLALGIDALVVAHGDGSGQWLSATPIAMGGAAIFATRLVRDVRSAQAAPAAQAAQ
jgi:hypothetical protein